MEVDTETGVEQMKEMEMLKRNLLFAGALMVGHDQMRLIDGERLTAWVILNSDDIFYF